MMIETKKRKVSISEEDVSLILQRYTATTILSLLQEVAQFSGVKIDWNVLVKKTSTGISNAREYQMLWRHLAYRTAFFEKLEDDGFEPSDDDSDLEIELEPSPAVNAEASAEAAACVKVLIASGLPSESCSSNRSTVEAPLTINIPNGQPACISLDNTQQGRSVEGTNITIPVSVQKQSLPSVLSVDGLDGNFSASASLPPRKKRKLWTPEEDMELIAAVQKCGEGNWATILKGYFKHDRTAAQLSQRWAIIRKRKAKVVPSNCGSSTGGALSEAQLAARKAVSLALNMPMKGTLSLISSASGNHSTICNSAAATPSTGSDAPTGSAQPAEVCSKPTVDGKLSMPHQSQQPSNQTPSSKVAGSSVPTQPKSRLTPKKPSTGTAARTLPTGPNPLIQAAAVAAGARIANPSTAASLFKAAQSRNAVHIRQGGSVPQSSMPAVRPLSTGAIGSKPPNVHFIVASQTPAYSGVINKPSCQPQGSSGRLAMAGQSLVACSTASSNEHSAVESKVPSVMGGSSDGKRATLPAVPKGRAAASAGKLAGENTESAPGLQKEIFGDHAPAKNSKEDGNHVPVDDPGEKMNSVVEQRDDMECEDPSVNTADSVMPASLMNGESADKQAVDMNGAVDEKGIENIPSSLRKSEAGVNLQKMEVLPSSNVNSSDHDKQKQADSASAGSKSAEAANAVRKPHIMLSAA